MQFLPPPILRKLRWPPQPLNLFCNQTARVQPHFQNKKQQKAKQKGRNHFKFYFHVCFGKESSSFKYSKALTLKTPSISVKFSLHNLNRVTDCTRFHQVLTVIMMRDEVVLFICLSGVTSSVRNSLFTFILCVCILCSCVYCHLLHIQLVH